MNTKEKFKDLVAARTAAYDTYTNAHSVVQAAYRVLDNLDTDTACDFRNAAYAAVNDAKAKRDIALTSLCSRDKDIEEFNTARQARYEEKIREEYERERYENEVRDAAKKAHDDYLKADLHYQIALSARTDARILMLTTAEDANFYEA